MKLEDFDAQTQKFFLALIKMKRRSKMLVEVVYEDKKELMTVRKLKKKLNL
jgi:hypothetical protein